MNDLRALADVLGLKIMREEYLGGTPTVVVKNEKDEDVHIGFPDRRNMSPNAPVQLRMAQATRRIASVDMSFIGSGGWDYRINL
ncbi:MAG: hypothetical protein A2741_02175 [Candidatus Zambryskibacteria bacterium RIFCSPHIGHO2_01_FULL_43_27]|uniref:Uncharacterized protein n=1 Tax=Candidatus Zambryskibacteria bacterium RIFCSPLOWO2_01_FULL_43_17 TaxID=1802760 RepID=A0A1G2U501_9BACT|nr:MAG: hypothetical protein A2741_02175 [Candidatus Zambryskibacteria bacterium RIFCSPHIGHO2_01_FULL_43_27]OHB00487.1 MAG: hypothetical protein A3E93_01665 [Candidatus Zambryskibacteria bacterium RIFCSPHIGHO2_12_FULL_43_12b]OHB04564.1 MAG: hypothetical protein A2920_01295 [Candidatus Zambryskibacteria bacterium RIFCSPLOWO2_01_FULL_43_17]